MAVFSKSSKTCHDSFSVVSVMYSCFDSKQIPEFDLKCRFERY